MKCHTLFMLTLNLSLKKSDECSNNSENSSAEKVVQNSPCGYSMSTTWAFDHIENKHTLYRGEDWMKTFCTYFREHATNVINFKKKKMLPLTKQKLKSYKDFKAIHICGKKIFKKFANDNNYQKG